MLLVFSLEPPAFQGVWQFRTWSGQVQTWPKNTQARHTIVNRVGHVNLLGCYIWGRKGVKYVERMGSLALHTCTLLTLVYFDRYPFATRSVANSVADVFLLTCLRFRDRMQCIMVKEVDKLSNILFHRSSA